MGSRGERRLTGLNEIASMELPWGSWGSLEAPSSGDAPATRCEGSIGDTIAWRGNGLDALNRAITPGGSNGGAQTRSVGAGPLGKMVL